MAGRFVATGVLLVSAAALQARPPTSCNLSKDATGLSVLGPRPRPTPLPRPRSPIIVTNTNDSGAGSLRQALADAQDGDIISFAPALLGQTVTLTSAEIVIGKNITIGGPASGRLAISRSLSSPPFRIFHVMPYWSVAIQGLTITGGTVELDESGAGILNDHATLTVSNCTIEFNGSADCGGGICNDGSDGSATLSIVDSTISSNFSSGEGGGICNNGSNGSATSNVVNSAVTGNTSPLGGGIINEADQGNSTLTITNSTVSANSGAGGSPPTYFGAAGGIANYGTVVITNSTVSDNLAANDSGGISNFGTLTLANSAVTGNRAGGVGGTSYPGSGAAFLQLEHSSSATARLAGTRLWAILSKALAAVAVS